MLVFLEMVCYVGIFGDGVLCIILEMVCYVGMFGDVVLCWSF